MKRRAIMPKHRIFKHEVYMPKVQNCYSIESFSKEYMAKVQKCQSTEFQNAEFYKGEYYGSIETSKHRIHKQRRYAKVQNSLTTQNFKAQNSLKFRELFCRCEQKPGTNFNCPMWHQILDARVKKVQEFH
jgi:hypothetical protein